MLKNLTLTLFGLIIAFVGTLEAKANTDYICYEKVTCENTCTVKSWSIWDAKNHRRTGAGYKKCTITSYYSLRQSCAASYPSGVAGAERISTEQETVICGKLTTTEKDVIAGNTGGATGAHKANTSAPSIPCSVYQYDKIIPSCSFRTVGADLQFRCVPNGNSACKNYQIWTKVDYAVPSKMTTIGIGTEAGMYNACVVPTKN